MTSSLLLFGGASDERLVSVASAQNLARRVSFEALWFLSSSGQLHAVEARELENHQDPFQKPFKPTRPAFADNLTEALKGCVGKIVFVALHGDEGEDGTIQASFEHAGVRFTGSDSRASADCFDKAKAKMIVAAAEIPLAKQVLLQPGSESEIRQQIQSAFESLGPVVLKPVASGSSVGLHMIHQESQIAAASQAIAGSKFQSYLCEQFVSGRELTVGVVNGPTPHDLRALCPSEVKLAQGHAFDYQGKYLGRGSTELTPAPLTDAETRAAQNLAKRAHLALNCFGYSRTDMILTSGGLVFLETNTLPGLSKASFVPQQLAYENTTLDVFVHGQLHLASQR